MQGTLAESLEPLARNCDCLAKSTFLPDGYWYMDVSPPNSDHWAESGAIFLQDSTHGLLGFTGERLQPGTRFSWIALVGLDRRL